jgi:hypothetical protein
MVAGAFIERDGLRLVAAGLQANGHEAAAHGDFFEGQEKGSTETAATVAVLYIHALHFDCARVAHGPERAASDRDVLDASQKKHAARFEEIRGVDAMNFETRIAALRSRSRASINAAASGAVGSTSSKIRDCEFIAI